MAIGKDGAVRRQLRTLFNVGTVRDLTDGQLLERFATDRGEAAELAFAVLVERHGPMVMRVCRAVLGDSHDAQDAFQATFLVLVKRARGLWVRDSIGPWLHQVAYRTASCARTAAARHRRLERNAAITAQETRPERDFELERLLHEEIDRLPERYRSPIVLCDLEGRTYEQAARHLGWPVGHGQEPALHAAATASAMGCSAAAWPPMWASSSPAWGRKPRSSPSPLPCWIPRPRPRCDSPRSVRPSGDRPLHLPRESYEPCR